MPLVDALTFREQGNQCFRDGDVETAIVKYRTALQLAKPDTHQAHTATGTTQGSTVHGGAVGSATTELLLALHLNLALCHLKTQEWQLALDQADAAVSISPMHPKALYRAACATLELAQFDQCATHLNNLLKIERTSKEGILLLTKLKETMMKNKDALDKESSGFRLQDSLRVIKEFANCKDGFSDTPALSLGIEVVNTWLVKSGKPEVLSKEGAIEDMWRAVQRCMEEMDYLYSCVKLEAIGRGCRFLQLMVLEVLDRSEESKAEFERQEALRLNSDVEVAEDVQERRHRLFNLMDLSAMHSWVRNVISAGISEISEEQAKRDELLQAKWLRREILVRVMDLLHYVGNLDDSSLMLCLSEGLKAVECRPVQSKALTSLTFLADRKRRRGLQTTALTLSHGLQCCLEALVSMLEDEPGFQVDAFDLGEEMKDAGARRQCEFCLTSIFYLLADKERSADAAVSWNTITAALVSPRLEMSRSESEKFAAYQTLNIMWLADRQEVFRFSLQCALPLRAIDTATTKTFQDTRLQKAAAEYVLNVVEFPEMRLMIIEGDGVTKLIDNANSSKSVVDVSFRCQLLAILARLSVHSDFLREMIFDTVDFIEITKDIIKLLDFYKLESSLKNGAYASSRRILRSIEHLLEILFFISLHVEFKREVLGLPPLPAFNSGLPDLPPDATAEQRQERDEEERKLRIAWLEKEDSKLASPSFDMKLERLRGGYLETIGNLGKFVAEFGSSEAGFLFAGLLHNLTRSALDKDRLKKTRNSPDFDEAQMAQLQYIYEKLPGKAKPQEASHYYRGGPNLNSLLRESLLKHKIIIPSLKAIALRKSPPATSNLLKLCSLSVRQLCQHPQLRSELFRQGGFQIVRKATEGFQDAPDEIRDFRQTVAHFAMSINPINFSYAEVMGMTVQLLVLLEDNYELFAYEAALGLTNLMSNHEDVRNRVWASGEGYKVLREVAISENEMLRAAGIELICNLFVSDKVKAEFYHKYIETGVFDFDVSILLSFLNETENVRAWRAAAGALSIMSQDCRLALCLARHEKFSNGISSIELAIKRKLEDIQERLIVFLTNVWKSMQWMLTQADSKEFEDNDKILRNMGDMTKKLFVFFGMLDASLPAASRELLKNEVTLYPNCPIMPYLEKMDQLPPAVAAFWNAINCSSNEVIPQS